MKKVIFIGNRNGVLKEIRRFKELELIHVFIPENSYLEKDINKLNVSYNLFTPSEKEAVFKKISLMNFDILISNGCPLILPISALKKTHQLFINVHPSYLPYLRGKNPVNGVFLTRSKFTGVTIHYMNDKADEGNIIYQTKVPVTEDLDLGILYSLLFNLLEPLVFIEGMKKIIKANFNFKGTKQPSNGSSYKRSVEDMRIYFKEMLIEEIITRIKAFGIKSQGVEAQIGDTKYKIYSAEKILNKYILKNYENVKAGKILLRYENKMLIKCKDGILKITSFLPLI